MLLQETADGEGPAAILGVVRAGRVASGVHTLQSVVIPGPLPFEVTRQVQDRLGQRALLAQEEADEQPFHPAVAVEEGMARLELRVGHADPDEGGKVVARVQEALELGQGVGHQVGRRRDEGRLGQDRSSRGDPGRGRSRP